MSNAMMSLSGGGAHLRGGKQAKRAKNVAKAARADANNEVCAQISRPRLSNILYCVGVTAHQAPRARETATTAVTNYPLKLKRRLLRLRRPWLSTAPHWIITPHLIFLKSTGTEQYPIFFGIYPHRTPAYTPIEYTYDSRLLSPPLSSTHARTSPRTSRGTARAGPGARRCPRTCPPCWATATSRRSPCSAPPAPSARRRWTSRRSTRWGAGQVG
jgi:hypothetical protein